MRTNDEWLRDLRAEGDAQAKALEELRGYLLRALPGSLKQVGGMPRDLLEDVVQDALMRALDHLEDFEGRSRFTTWATTIAVRGAMTELRRHRWRDVSIEELTSGETVLPRQHADPGSDPETHAAQLGLLRAMQEILETQLSDRQRITIVAELQGMPQEEIGRRLGTTRNAVYKLAYDARKKLKRGLEAAGFDASTIQSTFS